jgi:ABC-type metal ion transport system substrate-binding protein
MRTDRMKKGERLFLPCDSSESGRALYIRAKAAVQVARGEFLILRFVVI